MARQAPTGTQRLIGYRPSQRFPPGDLQSSGEVVDLVVGPGLTRCQGSAARRRSRRSPTRPLDRSAPTGIDQQRGPHLLRSAELGPAFTAEADHNTFNYHWRRAAEAAGAKGLRYHSLRHAFASMLISGGCSVKAVQRALGHASAATTLNLYAHIWPGDDDRIRQAVNHAFGSEAEDSSRTVGDAL